MEVLLYNLWSCYLDGRPLLRDIFSSPRGCCGERDNKYRVSDVFKVLIVRPNTDTRTISIYESFQANAKHFFVVIIFFSLVPSLPPTNLAAYNTSSTSLMVTWNPVPQGFTHGIVLGYMVLYKRERDVNESYSNITSVVTSAQLTNLDKFTMYGIKVSAFTIKGNGAMTNYTYERTHEDG